jgi:hypothetical protein
VEVGSLATRKQKAGEEAPKKSTLVSAPTAIGTADGKIASPTGAAPQTPPAAKSMKKGKLAAKHKSRLPRRQKKAQQKARASAIRGERVSNPER